MLTHMKGPKRRTPLDLWRKTYSMPNASATKLARLVGKDEIYVLSTPPSIDPYAKKGTL